MRTLAALLFVGLLVPGCGTDDTLDDLDDTFDEDLIDETGVVIEPEDTIDEGDDLTGDGTGDGSGDGSSGGDRGEGSGTGGGMERPPTPCEGADCPPPGPGGENGGTKEDCPPGEAP